MSRNAYEIRTLLRIGFFPQVVIKSFFLYFVKIFGIVSSLGLLVFFVFKYFLDTMFESGGLYIDTQISMIALLSLAGTYLLFVLASYRTAKNGIFKQY